MLALRRRLRQPPATVTVQLISDLELPPPRVPVVIVRRGGGTTPPPPSSRRGPHQLTLVGLGEDDDAIRPTLPFLGDAADWDTGFGESPLPARALARATATGWSIEPDRRRPVTLIDDVDDAVAAAYRAEACAILQNMQTPRPRGLFAVVQSLLEGLRNALRTAIA